jgi:hypothetical protein
MARRSTLENVDAAQRAGVRARFSGEGVDPTGRRRGSSPGKLGSRVTSSSAAETTGRPAGIGSRRLRRDP